MRKICQLFQQCQTITYTEDNIITRVVNRSMKTKKQGFGSSELPEDIDLTLCLQHKRGDIITRGVTRRKMTKKHVLAFRFYYNILFTNVFSYQYLFEVAYFVWVEALRPSQKIFSHVGMFSWVGPVLSKTST